MSIHAVYGTPPAALVSIPADAAQYSPLMPGALALETREAESLASMAMLAPAGTIERRYALAHALRALQPGGTLTALAPRDKGGSRIANDLKQFGCTAQEESKQHHRICKTTRPETLMGIEQAIDEGAPRYLDALGLWSQPGVFSWDRIDAGSALLAEHVPPFTGRGLDLGCGIGFLARAVLTSPQVTHLTMMDIDRRAIAMATKNVDAARTTILWADVTKTEAPNADFIVMNPPFHDGGIEDRTLGQAFIQRAAQALRTGGSCWLVANRHLPYEAVMKPLFTRITLQAETGGFKIYEAVK